MNLKDVVLKAYKKNWSLTNNFRVFLHLPQIENHAFEGLPFVDMGDELNMHIQNIDLPDLQASGNIEQWVVDKNRFHLGQDQPYRFTINFLDSDNLMLWRAFLSAYDLTKYNYFDNIKVVISVHKESDYDESEPLTHIITFSECIIEGVNKVPFSNEDDPSIQKFGVQFKAAKYEL